MKKRVSMLLAMCLVLGTAAFTGCGKEGGAAGAQSKTSEDIVYAVEAGSAGEAVAQENGYKFNSVASQADALMEVASGTSDAAIIDLLMAGAMIGEGTSYPNLIHTNELTSEKYGVGCRKGSDLPAFINGVFLQAEKDGSLVEIAETYGVQESLLSFAGTEMSGPSGDGDVAYIQGKGTLIVGITDFAPMDYKDESGKWIGFDADMARKVADALGVEVSFVEIDWDNKIMELDSKNIDVVWNGMTLTDEVLAAMDCSAPYCNNAQVVVIPID